MIFSQYEEYLKVAAAIVIAAGQIISEAQNRKHTIIIESKAKDDIVTNIDFLVEDYIVQELKKHFPKHKILAEERGLLGDLNGDHLWVLDPIDGTKNFARHNPHCCISLALQYKHDDIFETCLGIVYQPAVNRMFTAIKGQGAYLNNQPIKVSALTDLEQAVICLGYGYASRAESYPHRFKNTKFITEMLTFRMMGASALDLAYVAAGIFDGLFLMHTAQIWDVEAGLLLVKEAGGIVIDPSTGLQHHEGPLIAGNAQIAQNIFERYHQHSTK